MKKLSSIFVSFVIINQKIKTMKIEKNFTTGVLSGICGILVLVVMMGSTTPEITTKFEFHDLGDTRGLIFNKVTGQMEYKEIRTEPLNNLMEDNFIYGNGKYIPIVMGNKGYTVNTTNGSWENKFMIME